MLAQQWALYQTISMKTYKQLVSETNDKSFTVGKMKHKAVIKKVGSKFVATIDGDKLDKFSSMEAAEKAIDQFVELMGK